MQPNDWMETARRVGSVAREKEARVLAASLAYYMFNSLVPLLILVFIGLSLRGELTVLARAVELVTNVESQRLERLFKLVTSAAPTRRRVMLLALVILVWSSVRLFIAIDSAFSIVFGNYDSRSIVRMLVQVVYALVTVMTAIGVLIGIGVTLMIVVKRNEIILASALLFLVLFVVFLPMFYIFPKGDVTLHEALPGTAITALFWGISGLAFRFYSTNSPSIEFYGVIGGVLILLSWLYLGALALIMGIILNGVLVDAPGIERSL